MDLRWSRSFSLVCFSCSLHRGGGGKDRKGRRGGEGRGEHERKGRKGRQREERGGEDESEMEPSHPSSLLYDQFQCLS
jgi:hypothetical protein